MDVSFLDRLRVSPGDETAVMYLIEMAATQIATALVCSANNPGGTKDPPRDLKRQQAYKVCLDIVHRAMARSTKERNDMSALPPALVFGLLQHPMLIHIVVTLDYTHLLLCEKIKRSAWLRVSSGGTATDQAMQAFTIEAVWSLLTCGADLSGHDRASSRRDSPTRTLTRGGERNGITQPRAAVTTKANAQSPPTVGERTDSPANPVEISKSLSPNLFSPLSCVPIWIRPVPDASHDEKEPDEKEEETPPSPRPRASPTMSVLLPLPAKSEEWTLQDKKTHQATRLFRLHHAAECTNNQTCSVPSCASMKHVLRCCQRLDGMTKCQLPFCFGAKCAIMHLQSCDRVEDCSICRDYWQRVACHTVAMKETNQNQPQVQDKGAREPVVTPPAVPLAKQSLKRQQSGKLEWPTATKRRSTKAKRVANKDSFMADMEASNMKL